tara:strand:- start:329 stop:1180 length:852 start_codon:yes stop_codon:yes gene_type:complete
MIKTRHILGLSGGKDSAALAIHMNNKHPEIDVEYFFTDTGYELPETYKFLDKLKTRLDKEIHVIQPVNSFDYYMKKYNNFLPSQNARWCTIEMKLKAMEKWLKPYLDANDEIVTLIGIRFDERGRTGYKSNNPSIKARFPFIEDMIDRDGVLSILEESGLGLPEYYKWRSRSGCTFCFFQKKVEWIGLRENNPSAWEHAKSLEKKATKNQSAFTWIKDLPLTELEKPEVIERVKEQHKKQLEKLKLNKNKKHQNNPFLKDENINVEENLALDEVSSSCLICHK